MTTIEELERKHKPHLTGDYESAYIDAIALCRTLQQQLAEREEVIAAFRSMPIVIDAECYLAAPAPSADGAGDGDGI